MRLSLDILHFIEELNEPIPILAETFHLLHLEGQDISQIYIPSKKILKMLKIGY